MARMDLCGNESPIGSIENIDFSLPLAHLSLSQGT